MDKLYDDVIKELKHIEERGLNSHNLELVYKLSAVGKNLKKIEKYERKAKEMEEKYGWEAEDKLHEHLRYLKEATDAFLREKEKSESSMKQAYLNEYIDKIMDSILCYVKHLMLHCKTDEERDLIRLHIRKMTELK